MNDDLKTVRDSFLKAILTGNGKTEDKSPPLRMIRDLVQTLASIAGKGKDEIVQMISREIGMAVAGVLKEPVIQILKDRQLKVIIQLEPTQKSAKRSEEDHKPKSLKVKKNAKSKT